MAPLSSSLSPLSASARRGVRLVLLCEIAVNVGNGLVSLFAPALALQGMTRVALREGADEAGGAQGVGLEVARWFGVMGAVFGGFLLARVLERPAALRPLLSASKWLLTASMWLLTARPMSSTMAGRIFLPLSNSKK